MSLLLHHARTIGAAHKGQTALFLILLLLALIASPGTAGQSALQEQRSDPPQPLAVAGDIDPSFDPGIGVTTGGTVSAVAVQSDGKIVIGGSFTVCNGVVRNGIARINSDGSLDTAFNPGTGANGPVNAVAIQSDGKILIGGSFTTYNGVSRSRIARINSDGGLDTSFLPGAVLNNTVFAIAVQSDGKILLGGSFNPLNRIARYNSDGSVDNTFHISINNTVFAIAVQSDGKIVLGGSFTNFGAALNYAARFNSDASSDTSFSPFIGSVPNGGIFSVAIQPDGKFVIGGLFKQGSASAILARLNSNGSFDSFSGLSGNTGSMVFAIALQSDGRILVGGSFGVTFNNVGGPTRNGILRLNTDGSLDSAFDPGAGVSVNALAIQNDGKVLLGGGFTNYNGASRNGILRVNIDGSLDTALNPDGGAGTGGSVAAIAVQTDGKIVLAGSFTSYNKVSRNGIARVNSDGSLDPSFNPGVGPGNGGISRLAIQTDGRIVLVGGFTSYNGVSRTGIARINADGSLDSSFDPGTGANNIVTAVAIQNDSKIMIGGGFGFYNGVGRIGIARINSNGSLDATFDPGSGANTNPNVQALAIQSDGKILLAGGFSTYNGVSRVGIARVSTNGTLDTSFDPGSGTSGLADALAIQADGKLVIGGLFSYNGVNRNGIARVTANGSLDTSFDPGTGATTFGTSPGTVIALGIQGDGRIVIAGQFFNYNGTSRVDIARTNGDGSLDTSFDPGTGASNFVNTLAIQGDGKIVIGGFFSSYNGVNRNGIARVFGAASPTIQFSTGSYTINEGDPNGRVNIILTRGGDTTNSASVTFATNDGAALTNCNVFNGTASPRCDYSNTIGTANWAAGDAASKSFSIAIVDDSYAEGTESFTIGLNSPSGATLGTQSTATVTITDNETTNGPNPIDGTNFFVRQQYLDFLGREPDPFGFAGWTSTINNCSGDTTQCDRIHVSQLFFQSQEFQERGYFVYRFYPVAYGRKPDYGEFVPDLASVSGFLDATQLEAAKVAFVNGFMARTAFVSAYSFPNTPTGNQQYVDMLLNTAGVTLSNRQAMIDGLNNSTMTRGQVLRQIVESSEVSIKYNHQAYAVMEYFGYLRRQPDSFYLQWIAVLDATNDPRGMVTGFVTSQEYRNRFGP